MIMKNLFMMEVHLPFLAYLTKQPIIFISGLKMMLLLLIKIKDMTFILVVGLGMLQLQNIFLLNLGLGMIAKQ